MKFWVIGISVSIVAAAQARAQSNGNPNRFPESRDQQRIESFELAHGNGWDISRAPPHSQGESGVVSLQSLQHPTNVQAERIARKGLREFRQGHLDKALPLLQKAVLLDPKSISSENNLGVLYCALGRDKEAQRAFEVAIEADPGSSASYQNLSSISFNTYQYRLAEKSARRALQLTPLAPGAKIMLALSVVAQGYWTPEAKKILIEYRSSFAEADRILRVWPSPGAGGNTPKPTVAVQGAGPGAFRLTVDQQPPPPTAR